MFLWRVGWGRSGSPQQSLIHYWSQTSIWSALTAGKQLLPAPECLLQTASERNTPEALTARAASWQCCRFALLLQGMAVPPGLGALGSLAMNSGKPTNLNTLPLPWDEFSLLTKEGEDNIPLYQRDSRGQTLVDIVFDVAMLKVSTCTLRRWRGCLRVRWMDPFLVGTRGDNTYPQYGGVKCA